MLGVCKYNLRSPNCALPRDLQEDLIWFLARSGGGVDYNEKFDENHPNHYKKHYKGVKEMIEEMDRKSEEEYQEWFQGWYQKSLQSGTAAPLSEATE